MKKCAHKKVVFSGFQETLEEGKMMILYRCLSCGSTITLEKDPKSIVEIQRKQEYAVK